MDALQSQVLAARQAEGGERGKRKGKGKGKEKAARHDWKGEPTVLLIRSSGLGRHFNHHQQWRSDAGGSKKETY